MNLIALSGIMFISITMFLVFVASVGVPASEPAKGKVTPVAE